MTSESGFRELTDGITTALVDTTRTAGQISNEDLAFHRSTNPSIVPLLERQSARLLSLAKDLTRVATSESGIPTPKISSADSVDDNWRGIVDIFDNLLEKADACLDEYTGVIKRLSPSQEEQIQRAANAPYKRGPSRTYRTQNIAKPQMRFSDVPDNYDSTPFKPLLKSKPHALISFEQSMQLVNFEDGSKQYKQPYETEIIVVQTPPKTFVKSEPVPPLPFHSTTATFVDSLEAVYAMLGDLKKAEEIAIDLEHHEEHSYLGIVSLMQISSREKDWVVDTLKPWRQDLQILNEVFTDPKILKVFHGATMDMIWLQRDLGLYIVGLFDTFHACCALGYPKRSLAFLLKKFVDFDAAKQYQTADWRIRPLPEEMFNYARSDTHYLLYVFDMMRNELIEASDQSQPDGNLIEVVMQNSKQESLQRYERPVYDAEGGRGINGWFNALRRSSSTFNREQFAVYRALHQWRDEVARREDVSPAMIVPNRVMHNIARELPSDVLSLTGCCYGAYQSSESLRKHKENMSEVVQNARAAGITGPDMQDIFDDTKITPSSSAIQPVSKDLAQSTSDEKQAQTASLGANAALPVKSEESIFWGPIIGITSTSERKTQRHVENLQLALPLPNLTAEVFVRPDMQGNMNSGLSKAPKHRVEHQFSKAAKPEDDGIFIVKDTAGSRKRKVVETTSDLASEHAQNGANEEPVDEMAVDVEGQAAEEERAERKGEKAERKAERKRQALVEASRKAEETPFDYANAPSVLHAKQSQEGKRKMASKGANPYAKSLDAPKGMRRAQKEAPGKSFTFKK